MGKVVKYCTSCDESFAEKFGFCPTCGSTLDAFEMNPLADASAPAAMAEPEVEVATGRAVEPLVVEETVVEPVTAEPVEIADAAPVVSRPAYSYAKAMDADTVRTPVDTYSSSDDGLFHITVIEEKNVKQRNSLLLGSLSFMILVLLVGVVVSIFNRDFAVGSVNDGIFNALLLEDVPMTVEEEQQKKNADKGGGGGGGGRDEKEEVTKGDLADQSKTPTRPPDAKVFRSDNFELKTPSPQTEGTLKFPKENQVWGDPNGRFTSLSNGTGTGGGQGSGRGTGQGSGSGTGAGSGTGSGYGAGIGDGVGDGTGTGVGGGPPPPPRPAGVTKNLVVTGKPKPGYTDAARVANTQGVVVLKVMFLASGQIGSISTVKGLPNGLTEKAIEAARRMSFTPKMVDGVAQNVSKNVEFSFAIY